MTLIAALLSGLVFGCGLILAGMANPAKVLGFLDLAGRWDPSLVLVMGGAVTVALLAFARAKSGARALNGATLQIPQKRTLDRRLLLGSLLFGLGWGTAGFCPGPALVALGAGIPKAAIFVAAMLLGMLIFQFQQRD